MCTRPWLSYIHVLHLWWSSVWMVLNTRKMTLKTKHSFISTHCVLAQEWPRKQYIHSLAHTVCLPRIKRKMDRFYISTHCVLTQKWRRKQYIHTLGHVGVPRDYPWLQDFGSPFYYFGGGGLNDPMNALAIPFSFAFSLGSSHYALCLHTILLPVFKWFKIQTDEDWGLAETLFWSCIHLLRRSFPCWRRFEVPSNVLASLHSDRKSVHVLQLFCLLWLWVVFTQCHIRLGINAIEWCKFVLLMYQLTLWDGAFTYINMDVYNFVIFLHQHTLCDDVSTHTNMFMVVKQICQYLCCFASARTVCWWFHKHKI